MAETTVSCDGSCIVNVGQRAAKLPAVKVGDLKKKSADSAISAEACASAFELVSPGLNHSQTLMVGNYAAL